MSKSKTEEVEKKSTSRRLGRTLFSISKLEKFDVVFKLMKFVLSRKSRNRSCQLILLWFDNVEPPFPSQACYEILIYYANKVFPLLLKVGDICNQIAKLKTERRVSPSSYFSYLQKNCCFKRKYLSFIFSHYSDNFMGMMQPSLGAQFALICLHASHDMFIKTCIV